MRIAPKFLVLLLAAFVLPILLVGMTAYVSMQRIAAQSTEEAMQRLTASEETRISQLTRETALRIDSALAAIENDVLDLAASYQYLNEHPEGVEPAEPPRHYSDRYTAGLPAYGYVHPDFGTFADYERRSGGCPWLPLRTVERVRTDPVFRHEIARSLHQMMALSPIFDRLTERHAALLDLVWIVLDSGLTNVAPAYDYYEVIREDPGIIHLDESEEDYVRLLNPQNNPERTVRWLEPYFDHFKRIWMTSCAAPLYQDDRFLGSTGMDILLPTISQMVSRMDPGSGGYALLVASSGKLIVSPERAIADLVWEDTHRQALSETYRPAHDQRWTPAMIEALEATTLDRSPNPAIRTLALETRAGMEGTRRALIGGTQRFVTYAPIARTGWTLAVVVPFERVVAPAQAIQGVIGDALRRAVWTFAAIAAGLLAFGLGLSRVFNAQLVRPVVRLTRAVERVSWENLELEEQEPDRPDEIGHLTRRFRHMLRLLREARDENQRKARAIETANEQVVKLEAVGTLAAGIAHDFNNLLTAIVGNVSLALFRLPRETPVRTWLEGAEAAGMRARDLTQQLLTFSKGGDPILQVVTLANVLSDSATFVLRGSKSRCEMEVPADLWPVEADAGQIGRVIQNLVLNADQASPEGGTIRLIARNVVLGEGEQEPLPSGRYVEVACVDAGTGIAAADLPRIFDAFYTTKSTGSGLGLSVCLSILRKHGGFIGAESVIGKGTTLRFWLPASERSIPEAARPHDEMPMGHGAILLMDNEEMVREFAMRALAELGYEATAVADGSRAVALYRERLEAARPFDAAILDLTVPGEMGGRETAKRIRELHADARLIVSSGYSADPVLADPGAYGFDAAVNKPYRIRQLAEVLWTAMQGIEDGL